MVEQSQPVRGAPELRSVIVLRVHEVALKGMNRRWFISTLRENIAFALRGIEIGKIWSRSSRTFVELKHLGDWPEARDKLRGVFGIANFSLGLECRPRMRAIKHAIRELFNVEGGPSGTFCVRARRANKRFRLTSPEIEREIGAYIQQLTDAPVDLSAPDQTYRVEVLYDSAYVSGEALPGPGGLPAGVSGRVVVLMSGGFDSPVAAYRMMKRGCQVTLLHCHAHPYVRSTSIEKVVELAQHIGENQPEIRLVTVPIGEAQQEIAIHSDPELRVVLYRRLMMRIATALAVEEGSGAIVTGESVGQVSSQTLENIKVIGCVTDLPILRPLIGFDKNEILEEARRLGTHEISAVPDDDCCSVFMPAHPRTRTSVAEADHAEEALEVARLVRQSLDRRTLFTGDPCTWDASRAVEIATV